MFYSCLCQTSKKKTHKQLGKEKKVYGGKESFVLALISNPPETQDNK